MPTWISQTGLEVLVCAKYQTPKNISEKKITIPFLFSMDFNTSAEQVVGMHEAPIKCVEYCPSLGMVIYSV